MKHADKAFTKYMRDAEQRWLNGQWDIYEASRDAFFTAYDSALNAAENEIDKCRYDAPDTPDDYLRGLDSASNAVGELRE
jgi:hypothetical protein